MIDLSSHTYLQGLFCKQRQLVLTDAPQIYCVDQLLWCSREKYRGKGVGLWTSSDFVVISRGKSVYTKNIVLRHPYTHVHECLQ